MTWQWPLPKKEGLKEQVDIGQIKEVIRVVFTELKKYPFGEVANIIVTQK